MTTLEKVSIKTDTQDTSAIADGDAAGRPLRVPPNPASVKINVEGAFIVDDEMSDRNGGGSEHVHWEHKDIRLPHHIDVVSHVAVDACSLRQQSFAPYPTDSNSRSGAPSRS